MSAYTDDNVKVGSRAIARQNMPNASDRLIDQLCDMGEWDHAARWVLDAVAPAIAARALRELADDLGESRIPVNDGGSSYIDLHARADEIERT